MTIYLLGSFLSVLAGEFAVRTYINKYTNGLSYTTLWKSGVIGILVIGCGILTTYNLHERVGTFQIIRSEQVEGQQ